MLGLVERGLHVEHGLLGRLEHGVEPAQDGHRQDHVAVLAADVEVAQHVVGDAPDEVGDPVQLALFHVNLGMAVLLRRSAGGTLPLTGAIGGAVGAQAPGVAPRRGGPTEVLGQRLTSAPHYERVASCTAALSS